MNFRKGPYISAPRRSFIIIISFSRARLCADRFVYVVYRFVDINRGEGIKGGEMEKPSTSVKHDDTFVQLHAPRLLTRVEAIDWNHLFHFRGGCVRRHKVTFHCTCKSECFSFNTGINYILFMMRHRCKMCRDNNRNFLTLFYNC